ncbi:CaiB/BaiF CoA transferase family protein [Caballeronia ptereochthonis]|uniref:Lipid metabolism-like protein n=1 Tax=Caballeronia ptereochthonis TaxID=1777144 RepID=A0A157ZTK9_9BURK|nr:CoA transferase [Caballeronia ptereochthonis]SAK48816.1 lipid metabolism-like protein [Caballeronia ptereochthonis]
MKTENEGPLSGLKVLDLSRFIAGPHCAMQLADLGADVTKVERVNSGDDTRALAPKVEDESLYFMVFNRNKRSITLNFREPRAQTLLRELIAKADVVIENFRPGTMEKMGCDWDTLHALNPRLIMARISGYGQTGSMASEPCFDAIAQASTGLMDLTGQPDGPPTVAGTFAVDYTTALYATIGVLSALSHRDKTGEGQMIDVSLMGCGVSLLLTAVCEQAMLGRTMTRVGSRDRYSSPAQTFKSRDGHWVYLIAGNDAHFPRLARAMQRPELLDDPRYATHASRMSHIAEVEAEVAEWVLQHDADEVVAKLRAVEVSCSKVATVADVVASPYMREAGHITTVRHPKAGDVTMQGLPIRLSATPASIRKSAPLLGEDSASVLDEWLGMSDADIAALRQGGVI